MDPMYAAMMKAQDPMAAQEQQLSYYHPLNVQQPQGGGMGMGMMGIGQMMQLAGQKRDDRINQVRNLSADGGSPL